MNLPDAKPQGKQAEGKASQKTNNTGTLKAQPFPAPKNEARANPYIVYNIHRQCNRTPQPHPPNYFKYNLHSGRQFEISQNKRCTCDRIVAEDFAGIVS